jgi:probable phosphoglycerate mutase
MTAWLDPHAPLHHQLLLVRHGEALHQIMGLTGGWTDTSLSPLGKRQARLLAGRLRRELRGVPVKLISSDLQRARQTADIIGRALGVRPVAARALREFNNGAAAGLSEDAAARIRRSRNVRRSLWDWRPFAGAETWRELYHRQAAYMKTAFTRDRLLIVVSHAGALSALMDWWFNIKLAWLTRIPMFFISGNTGLTVLSRNDLGERTVLRHNDTAHLENMSSAQRRRA